MFSLLKSPFMKLFGDLFDGLVSDHIMASRTINESMIIRQTYRTMILIFMKHRVVFAILEILYGFLIRKIDIFKLEHYLS